MSNIFISHSSHDKPFIESFCSSLAKNGYSTWYSGERILAAQNWDEEVTGAIVRCDFIITILTESVSNKPDQVIKELLYAQSIDKILLVYEIGDLEDKEPIKKIYSNLNRIQRKKFTSSVDFLNSFEANIVNDIKNIYSRILPSKEELDKLTKKVKSDFSKLEYFKDKFTLFSIQSTLPVTKHEGDWKFSDTEKSAYDIELTKFNDELKSNRDLTNEPHALMFFDEKKIPDVKEIKRLPYYSTNYVGVRLLRELGFKPKIISAGAITISSVEKKLYFQQRGNKVATYKEHFHIMGGNYIGEPDLSLDLSTTKVDKKLSRTIDREISEESDISLSSSDCETGIYSIGMEDDTGFIQVEAHAINLISKDEILEGKNKADISANWEGGIYGIGFDSLEDFLKYTYRWWVPSGFAHVMIWLALDAPSAPNLDGEKIYESVLNYIEHQEKSY